MKETKEGVVRMEMITELGLREILEFIYTGSVKISAEDNAQDQIGLPRRKNSATELKFFELTANVLLGKEV